MFSDVFEIYTDILYDGSHYQKKVEKYHFIFREDGRFVRISSSRQHRNSNYIIPATIDEFYFNLVNFYDVLYGVDNSYMWIRNFLEDQVIDLQFQNYENLKLFFSKILEREILAIQDMFYLNVNLALNMCRSFYSENEFVVQIFTEMIEEYNLRHQRFIENKLRFRISILHVLRRRLPLDRDTRKSVFKAIMDHVSR
jgi:hypothetical protein